MKRKLPLAIVFALFLAATGRAQPPTPQQPAYGSIENDPAFKRLPPEQQELVRQIMKNVDTAIAADKNTPAKAAPPNSTPSPNPQSGCAAGPVKKPGIHIPKALQDAINKQAKQLGKQTGVDLDPNAPAQAVKDAQKNIPCPPATPAPGQPAGGK
jgi:hypothetical protein